MLQLSQSNSTRVTLSDVQRDLTGYYKCEVSADAPLFHTEMRSSPVIVIGMYFFFFTILSYYNNN